MTRRDETYAVSVPGASSFPCSQGDTLLRAALRAGVPAAYECNSGGCGTCKFVVEDGEVAVLQEEPAGLTARDRRKGKQLACQTVPLGDLTAQLLLNPQWPSGHARPRRFSGEVTAVRPLTHDLVEITIVTDRPADFLPGQFAMVGLDGVAGGPAHTERAYSMSNLANPEGIWQFQVKRVPDGAVSGRVTGLTRGAVVHLDGPYGNAHLQDTDRDIVCVAGGSGLAPMVSVARGLAVRPDASRRRLDFFYGGRACRDRCAQEFVAEISGALSQVRFVEVLSAADEDDWDGPRGYVHEALAAAGPAELADRDIYIAGPPPMTDAVVRMLVLEWRIPVEQIHYDRFF
ncbi:2Fe-2S iron-sulfur cluster binding domain-containing protein [Nocardia coubleae]|uniref:2Fe-2S iron-sulfur cluster binding domain-containing protein n=2 Tax=Nocardia coubleae TaxID=356147 RepID=A0A846W167_9NOCA|nr:2Fe-2S iron-sulfur cluster binding domain-containing protein [Nocardia coubleae]